MNKICLVCKKEFSRRKRQSITNWNKQIYCSLACSNKNRVNIRYHKSCPNCKKEFITKNRKQISCSHKCANQLSPYWIGKKRDIDTILKISETRRKKCYKPTCPFKKGQTPWNKGKKQPQYSRENHWNWKGGATDKSKQIRHSIEYNEWRLGVYKRDYWTCQMCFIKQKFPVAHHIKTFKDYSELRFDIDNGVTLCRACHKKVHKEIGQSTRFQKMTPNNSQKQKTDLVEPVTYKLKLANA